MNRKELVPIKQKDLPISKSLLIALKNHARRSLHRRNAKTADIYLFDIEDGGKDFSGGWHWSDCVNDPDETYALAVKTNRVVKEGKFYKLLYKKGGINEIHNP